METVTSSDGTDIAFRREGAGDPVLLFHGGGPATSESWAQVVPALASGHEVTVMDRRGRGASRPIRDYSLEHEFDDLAAVVAALGGGVHLVAHSSGARVALLAVSRGLDVRSLTLYEPPLNFAAIDGALGHVERLLADGDIEAATEHFFTGVAATQEELEMVRSLPEVWARMVDAMPFAPVELAALRTLEVDATVCGRIDVPVLLLVGEFTEGPQFLDGLDEVEAALPDARRATIPGQRHLANAFAPEALAGAVREFIAALAAETTARR
jgi:pimeloyl-ACP methyl ester carboxylesterase